MKLLLQFAFAVVFCIGIAADRTEALPTNEPVPTANYITVGGVDWAWASPCSPYEPSCGVIDMTYQSTLGWMLPSVEIMTAAINDAGGLASWAALFGTSGNTTCASEWFSTYGSNCDYGDVLIGAVWNYEPSDYTGRSTLETFAYRVSAIPVPASLPLLAGAIAIFVARRRKVA